MMSNDGKKIMSDPEITYAIINEGGIDSTGLTYDEAIKRFKMLSDANEFNVEDGDGLESGDEELYTVRLVKEIRQSGPIMHEEIVVWANEASFKKEEVTDDDD
ncbi:MAG: hypothetical protein ACLUQQ_09075 [Lacticaseibacillus paracasei]